MTSVVFSWLWVVLSCVWFSQFDFIIFDTEKLITEIEEKPSIWDITSSD
jgi:hypothetical protein